MTGVASQPRPLPGPLQSVRRRRILAYVVDVLALQVLGLAFFPLSSFFNQEPTLATATAVVLAAGYFAWLQADGRRTLGQRLTGIWTAHESGRALTMGEALLRAFLIYALTWPLLQLNVLSVATAVLMALVLADVVHFLAHPQKRSWVDLVSRAVVVRRPADESAFPTPIRVAGRAAVAAAAAALFAGIWITRVQFVGLRGAIARVERALPRNHHLALSGEAGTDVVTVTYTVPMAVAIDPTARDLALRNLQLALVHEDDFRGFRFNYVLDHQRYVGLLPLRTLQTVAELDLELGN